MVKWLKIGFFSIQFINVCAQVDEQKPTLLSVHGYLETYYMYDFSKPDNNTRPDFIYSHNRHNEINLNLGFVKVSYDNDNVRMNLALMTGTYANANLSEEPGVLKNIYEADIGVRLSSDKDLWIDAGIFPSHIGFESAHTPSCWTLTRSILADNSPYFEAGAKISYKTGNGKWFLSGLVLNGWQRIQRVEGNSMPSFGTQVTYNPGASVTLNSSTFIGSDKPDSARLMRYFHNFYGVFEITKQLGLTVGFDYGIEEKHPEGKSFNVWMSPVAIARFVLTDKVAVAIRGEYYKDTNGVIISTGTVNGFKTAGVSLNFDYQITSDVIWRSEIRNFTSADAIFTKSNKPSKTNTFLGTSLSIAF